MARGPRPACGRVVHGKEVAAGGLGLCFACDRPGSRDGCSIKWQHVGDTEYWQELGAWSSTVGEEWKHARNIQQDPLMVGECICCRADCVAGMYHVFKWCRQKQESGGRTMELGQPSPLSRYPSTGIQVSQKVIVVVAEVVTVDTGSTEDPSRCTSCILPHRRICPLPSPCGADW